MHKSVSASPPPHTSTGFLGQRGSPVSGKQDGPQQTPCSLVQLLQDRVSQGTASSSAELARKRSQFCIGKRNVGKTHLAAFQGAAGKLPLDNSSPITRSTKTQTWRAGPRMLGDPKCNSCNTNKAKRSERNRDSAAANRGRAQGLFRWP